jgi:hypothetical protein
MKRLIMLFGILDLIALIYSFDHLIKILKIGHIFLWMNLIWLTLYFSLIFSGILLLKTSKTGFWVYYAQFPIKILMIAGLSVGFLLMLRRLAPDNKYFAYGVIITCLVIEIGRLIVTIIIQKKLFNPGPPENPKSELLPDGK